MPDGSAQRRAARFSIDAARATREHVGLLREHLGRSAIREPRPPSYANWHRSHDADRKTLAKQRAVSANVVGPVGIECVVVQRGRIHGLKRTVQSIQDQTWGHWQVTLIGPDAPAAAANAHDDRVVAHHVAARGALAEVNPVLAHEPRRDFVMVVEAGDMLAPDCFFEIAHLARQDPLVDLVYWDDDRLDVQGRRTDPRFRPSWSPDLLLGANYIGRSFAMRHRRFAAVGGLRTEFGDGAWWDLLLRAGLDETRVGRVPRVLTHLNRRPNPNVVQCVNVVEDHVARHELPATVTFERGTVRLAWEPAEWPHVTVVIPTRHNRPLVSRVLEGLAATDYPALDVVVVDNGERTDDNERWYVETFPALPLTVEWWTKPFNYSAVNNAGAAGARGEVLVFLNDDTELPEPRWLREMVGWVVQPGIGIVGAQMLDGDGKIQHGGVILGSDRFRRSPLPGDAPRFAVDVRAHLVVPQRARRHRRVPRGAAQRVRGSRRPRRAVRADGQRRRARSRRSERGHAQRRARRSPACDTSRHPRAAPTSPAPTSSPATGAISTG